MAIGGVTEGIIRAAAEMLALGLDPLRFIYTQNELERQILIEVKNQALEVKGILDQRLAVEIANQVSKIFG